MFLGRVVGAGEPQWTDEDRQLVFAWRDEESERHTCGRPAAESFAKDNAWAYRAEVVRCHACAALERAVHDYTKQDGADSAGIYPRFVTTPT